MRYVINPTYCNVAVLPVVTKGPSIYSSPVLALYFFITMQVQHSYNSRPPIVEFYLRSYALRYGSQKIQILVFTLIELVISALTNRCIRGYLLDHFARRGPKALS